MDLQKTGQLIRRRREARGITQKALAEALHVTDKAVSKWERCLSCPDVALLEPLAGQLGISVAELLQGELLQGELLQGEPLQGEPLQASAMPEKQNEPLRKMGSPDDSAGRCTEHFAGPRHCTPHALQRLAFCTCLLLFSAAGCICILCDLAVFGTLTWSRYPIAALIFTGVVLSPLLHRGAKGIRSCLILLSLAIVPFLFALAAFLQRPPLFLPIGLRMAAVGLAFFWSVYWVLHLLARRRMLALALCTLLAAFVCVAVDLILSRLIQTPFLDGWDLFTIAVFLCAAAFFLWLDQKTRMPHRYAESTGKTR